MEFINRIDSVLKEYRDRNCLADREGQRKLTYRNLDELSGKAAVKLRALGIRKGDTVMIRIGRSSEYIAAEYGAVRMGAVAIPVLPSYPEARTEYIRKDAGVKLILTEAFFDDIDRYDFDADRAKPDCFDVDRGEEAAEERRFIFYTSGSTGVPKGVVYHDRAVLNAVERNLTETILKIKPFIYAASGSMSFTVSITEYYRSFAVGGFVHILSEETRTDILKVQDYYAAHEISMGFLSPRMLRVYRNRDPFLKIIGTGSERVVNTWSDEYVITNGYGQTETVGGFCVFRIDKPYENTPVGKPLPGVSIRIADENDRDVPDGEEGYIIATGYFPREYHNLPEQTAKTFRNLGNGLVEVHTGDMGKILPDGNLLFVNRKDWMLKVHGQRVEPGEIEVCMNETEGVSASVVKGFEQDDGSMLLCGFYTGDASGDAICAHLAEKLPHYMIPNVIMRMERFPVNANGKVDRMALEKPDLSVNRTVYEAPQNKTEAAICRAMEKVLEIPEIGRNDDFYLLGGNSMNAVALCSECGMEGFSPRHVLMGKTPAGMAAQYATGTGSLKPPLTHRETAEKEYPLTLSQKYNFYDCDKINETIDLMDWRAYYELDGTVDLPRLKKAIEDSLKAHAAYGIRFTPDRKVIRKDVFEAAVAEVTVSPDAFEAFRRNKAARKRDLLNDPMFDIEIIHVEEKTFLSVNMTHQVFDGASIALLYDEISDRYEGREPARAADGFDIFDVAAYEKALEGSVFRAEAEAYFDRQFAGLKEKPKGDTEEHLDSAVRTVIAADLSNAGKETFLKQAGVSEITYIQAAYFLALSKCLERDQLTCKILHSGRDETAYRDIHGSIARAVFVAADIDPDMRVRRFLDTLQDAYQKAVYYDVIPLPEMAEKYPGAEQEIYLNYRGNAGKGFHLGEKQFQFLPIGYFFTGKHIEALFNLQIDELPDGRLSVSAGAGFFTKEKTEKIVAAFEKALELILKEEKLGDILKGM